MGEAFQDRKVRKVVFPNGRSCRRFLQIYLDRRSLRALFKGYVIRESEITGILTLNTLLLEFRKNSSSTVLSGLRKL